MLTSTVLSAKECQSASIQCHGLEEIKMELFKATVIAIAKYVSEVIRLCCIMVPTTILPRPRTSSLSNREDA
jgi:hypothetical protein